MLVNRLCFIFGIIILREGDAKLVNTLMKQAAMMIITFYVFIKLLNIHINKDIRIRYLLFLVICVPCIYFLRIYVASFSSALIVAVNALFAIRVIKTSFNSSITTSIISYAISYAVFLVTASIISVFGYLIALFMGNTYSNSIFATVLTLLIEILLLYLVFRLKRLKNGMPFLIERGSRDIGVYLSMTLLVAASFLGMNNATDLMYLIPVFFVMTGGLIVIFWWRKSLSQKYLEKAKAKEIQALQDEINHLKQHNDELSKIIHKDNKLIPALEYAVRQYLLTAETETDNTVLAEKGRMLLAQIENASKERRGIIISYEASNKSLPSTGVLSVDSLLLYMLQKSREQKIDFNLSISGSVKYLIENIITEQDINTLLADLIENAIIATKKSASKNILVQIGIADSHYFIGIYDSGLPFTPETISDIGVRRTTTHAGEGGSGIGLMTTFEMLKRYHASFIIEDFAENALFTKNVSVRFDNLEQFRVKTVTMEHKEPIPAWEAHAPLCGTGS